MSAVRIRVRCTSCGKLIAELIEGAYVIKCCRCGATCAQKSETPLDVQGSETAKETEGEGATQLPVVFDTAAKS